jgi:hypothetical protein
MGLEGDVAQAEELRRRPDCPGGDDFCAGPQTNPAAGVSRNCNHGSIFSLCAIEIRVYCLRLGLTNPEM